MRYRIALFSVNIDECIASNTRKVLSILLSYFDDEFGRCIVQERIYINAEMLFSKFCNVFFEDDIPLANLIYSLRDSAGYLRGEKSDLKKRYNLFS